MGDASAGTTRTWRESGRRSSPAPADRCSGDSALVLGAGGAARAAALALARLGCPLTVVNRTPAGAERLAALITAGVPGASCDWLALSDLTGADVARRRVVVNATSLGMAGEGKVPDLLADNVTAGQVVFDAVYASAPTDFLVAAQARGAAVDRRPDDAAGAGGRGVQPVDRRAGAAGSDERCRPRMRRRTTKKRSVLTGLGGDELEPIIDPAESLIDTGAGAAVGRRRRRRPAERRRAAATATGRRRAEVDELEEERDRVADDLDEHDLGERGVTTDDVLENIVRSQRTSKLRLGDILKEMGLVTDEQVESAIGRQKETRKRLGQLLLEDGVVTQLDLTKALAQKFGVSFLDLTSTRFDAAATAYIDEKLARRYGAVPVRFLDDGTLLVAMVDPQNLPAQEDLAIITGFQIQPAIASEEDVFGAIAKIYRERAEVGESAATARSRSSTRSRSPTSATPPKRRRSSSSSTPSSPSPSTTPRATSTSSRRPRSSWCASASTACCTRSCRSRGACSRASSAASRSWPSSTSPSAACRRTGASASWSAASPSTCASPRCRPCTARRSSCASSTSPT